MQGPFPASVAETERMMKLQDVLLKAMAKKLTWWEAAEIIGVTDRTMRRWRGRLESGGYFGLVDRRKGQPSDRRVPLATVEEVLRLYRETYFDLNIRHFHEKLAEQHQIELSYTWVQKALQGAGLVARRSKRRKHRRLRRLRESTHSYSPKLALVQIGSCGDFGRGRCVDPTRPITTLKTAWANARERAGVTGRLHDSRHTLITELAESGAGDQTIMDIAGHVSRQMLKHYSHIRMQAKRDALEAVSKKQQEAENGKKTEEAKRAQDCSVISPDAQKVEGESLQSPYSRVFRGL